MSSDSPQDDRPDRFHVDFTGELLNGIYQVEEKLAEGGMGTVYLGRDTNLGRRVVIKVPHVKFLGEAGFRARFSREIEELVRLEHPAIVRILAQGVHDDVPFFVLQYLGGGSLEDALAEREGGMSLDEALGWLPRIAATLDFVHARGTVHRDVKPGNIIFDEEGHVFLSDFGVAKALEEEEDQNLTGVGTGVGSPKYMAPEQITGGELTPAADQYALASAFYEALVGAPPFQEGTAIELLMKKRSDDPRPISEVRPDIAEGVSVAIQRGLSRSPAERFASCRDFASAIEESARPAPTVAAAETKRSAKPLILAAVVLALLFVGAARLLWTPELAPGGGEPSASGGATDEAGEMRLTLLEPGVEPRRALRYEVAPGPMGTAVLTTRQNRTVQADGQPEPMKFEGMGQDWELGIAVDEVHPTGDLRMSWYAEDFDLSVAKDAQGTVPEKYLALFRDFAGRVTLSPNGLARDSEVVSPVDPPATLKGDVDIMDWAMRTLAPVFPTAPVGVGARWEVTEPIALMGMRMTQTETYEVVSIDGNILTLDVFVAQTAPQQKLNFAAFGDIEATLLSLHTNGKAAVRVDLLNLIPVSNVYEMTMTQDMVMHELGPEVDGKKADVKAKVDVEMRIEVRRK